MGVVGGDHAREAALAAGEVRGGCTARGPRPGSGEVGGGRGGADHRQRAAACAVGHGRTSRLVQCESVRSDDADDARVGGVGAGVAPAALLVGEAGLRGRVIAGLIADAEAAGAEAVPFERQRDGLRHRQRVGAERCPAAGGLTPRARPVDRCRQTRPGGSRRRARPPAHRDWAEVAAAGLPLAPASVTQTRPCPIARSRGAAGMWMTRLTRLVAGSMRETVSSSRFVTQTPCGSNAIPRTPGAIATVCMVGRRPGWPMSIRHTLPPSPSVPHREPAPKTIASRPSAGHVDLAHDAPLRGIDLPDRRGAVRRRAERPHAATADRQRARVDAAGERCARGWSPGRSARLPRRVRPPRRRPRRPPAGAGRPRRTPSRPPSGA